MEIMDDDNIRSTDIEVDMSNLSVLWGEHFTTSYPLFSVTSGSVSFVNNANNTNSGGGGSGSVFESDLIIPLYVVIFVLAIVGNSLVLITLAQNKRMRTVTNVYLLNLVSFFTLVTFL
jgi:hypothetical protein